MSYRYDLCIFIIKPLLCNGLSGYLGCCRLLILLAKCCQNYYFKEAQRKAYIVDVFSLLSSRKYQVQNKNYRIIEGYIYIYIYIYLIIQYINVESNVSGVLCLLLFLVFSIYCIFAAFICFSCNLIFVSICFSCFFSHNKSEYPIQAILAT